MIVVFAKTNIFSVIATRIFSSNCIGHMGLKVTNIQKNSLLAIAFTFCKPILFSSGQNSRNFDKRCKPASRLFAPAYMFSLSDLWLYPRLGSSIVQFARFKHFCVCPLCRRISTPNEKSCDSSFCCGLHPKLLAKSLLFNY